MEQNKGITIFKRICWRLSFDSYRKISSRGKILRPTTRKTFYQLPKKQLKSEANELPFFITEVVGDSLSIATEKCCPGDVFLRTTTRKTICVQSSSLLSETPRRQSLRRKVVYDLKLSFDSYRILVSLWTLLSTVSSITVFLCRLSK